MVGMNTQIKLIQYVQIVKQYKQDLLQSNPYFVSLNLLLGNIIAIGTLLGEVGVCY